MDYFAAHFKLVVLRCKLWNAIYVWEWGDKLSNWVQAKLAYHAFINIDIVAIKPLMNQKSNTIARL